MTSPSDVTGGRALIRALKVRKSSTVSPTARRFQRRGVGLEGTGVPVDGVSASREQALDAPWAEEVPDRTVREALEPPAHLKRRGRSSGTHSSFDRVNRGGLRRETSRILGCEVVDQSWLEIGAPSEVVDSERKAQSTLSAREMINGLLLEVRRES